MFEHASISRCDVDVRMHSLSTPSLIVRHSRTHHSNTACANECACYRLHTFMCMCTHTHMHTHMHLTPALHSAWTAPLCPPYSSAMIRTMNINQLPNCRTIKHCSNNFENWSINFEWWKLQKKSIWPRMRTCVLNFWKNVELFEIVRMIIEQLIVVHQTSTLTWQTINEQLALSFNEPFVTHSIRHSMNVQTSCSRMIFCQFHIEMNQHSIAFVEKLR